MAAADVMRQAPESVGSRLHTGMFMPILWLLVSIQAACAVRGPTFTMRYQASQSAALSSAIAIAHCLCASSGETTNSMLRHVALLLALAANSTCVPRLPIVYFGNREVLNRSGSSFLSWITFSYGFLHRRSATNLPEKLELQHVPAVDFGLRTKTLRDRFERVGAGASLWLHLVRCCLKPLLLQYSFVLLKTLSEFGSRYALFNLLRCLENNVTSSNELWSWVGVMFLGFLSATVADAWLLWTTAGILYVSLESVLQTLVLEKFMRKETGHGQVKNGQNASSTSGAMFKDTYAIARAVLDSYYFPMVAFKTFLDVFYLTRLLSVKSLVAGALFPIATTLLSKRLAQQHQVLQRSHITSKRKTTDSLTEMLQSLHQIRLSSLEDFWNRRLRGSIADEQRCRWATSRALEKLNFFSSLGPILLASVAIAVHALESGSLSPAVAFTALSFFGNLQGIFALLPAKAATLHKSWVSIRDLQAYLSQPDKRKCAVLAEELVLEEAALAWPGTPGETDAAPFALTDITLCFPRNELTVVTGKVGSGKSLLLAALLDEASVTSGRLGRPKLGAPTADGIVPGSTAYVSQPPWIDNCSIKDNIVFGYTFNAERYEKVIKACALDQDLAALANGDTTVAGAGGSALSGGQKWRVALARALYSPAETLILEDVLGAVDTPIASWICEHALTGEFATGRTVILATHRPEFCISAARYVVTVENGTVSGRLQKPVSLTRTGCDTSLPKTRVEVAEEEKSAALNEQPKRSSSLPRTQLSASRIVMFYLRLAGFRLYFFGVFMTVTCQALNAGYTWWLTRWTSSNDGDPSHHAVTIWNVVLYILLSVAGVLALTAQSLVFATVGIAASKALYQHIVQRVLGATLLWIDSTPFGKLFEVIDTDMHVMDDLIAPALNGILGTVLQLGLIIVVSLYSNVYTAVSSIIILALYAYIGPLMIEPGRRLRGLLGPASHPVSDHTNAMELGRTTIRAFGQTQLFMDRFYELVDDSSTVGAHIILGNCWGTIRSGLLGAAFVTSTAAAMVYNNIDAATAGFTITLALQMKTTLAKLLSQISTIRLGLSAADRVIALTEAPTESDSGSEIPEWPLQGSLEVDSISMKYGPDMPAVLNNVSFSAPSHGRVGIVGRTGAGKSSLTNALLRFVGLADGEIRIDGVNIDDIPLRQLRSAVKIIPQEPLLFSGTLRCNLDPGGHRTDEDLIVALKRVRLTSEKSGEATDSFSLGMTIEPAGANLSHGQRQLVCLARTILAQCRILVLDEATSGMDGTTDAVIQKMVRDEFSHTTVIVVAHKLLTVARFDKILVMSEGEICEAGTPAELLEKRGVFFDMVNRSGVKGKIEAAIKGKV